jgi:hypothetical protein
VTDPFLLSGSDDGPYAAASADRIGRLAAKTGLARATLANLAPQALDSLDEAVAYSEEQEQTWGALADEIARVLTAAGFRRHHLHGRRGGFHLCLWDDGIILMWAATEAPDDQVTPFERLVERAMHPALERILVASGFTASIIPEEEDNGGCIRVTDWHDPE